MKQLMKSKLYKLIMAGVIVAEGNKTAMKKLQKQTTGSFVAMGSPLPSIGLEWSPRPKSIHG